MTFEGAGRCIYLSIYLVLVFGYFRQKCFWLVLSIYLQYQTVHLSSHKNGHIICFCLICIKADIQNCISRTHIGTTVLTVPSFISVFWLVWEIRIKPHLFNHETHFNLNRCSFKLYAFSSCGVLSWEKTLSSTVWMKSSCDEHSSDYTSNSHIDFIEKQGAKGYWPVDYATVNNAINKWLDYIYLQCIIIFQPHLCINDFLKHNFHFSCSKQEVKHGFPDWFRNLKQK